MQPDLPQPMLSRSKQPQSFFATRDFTAAWRVYAQWLHRQAQLGRQHEVKLAGCRINRRTCWEVLITQELHDDFLEYSNC